MVTIERRVGRLVEIRVRGQNELSGFARVIALANEVGPDATVVLLVDAREGQPLSPDETQALARVQRASRERIAASVMLIRDAPVHGMVAERIREASGFDHHVARTPADALARLAPLLNSAELARARSFLE